MEPTGLPASLPRAGLRQAAAVAADGSVSAAAADTSTLSEAEKLERDLETCDVMDLLCGARHSTAQHEGGF